MRFLTMTQRGLSAVFSLAICTVLGSIALSAHALDVAGVNYQPTAQASGAALQLNGAGVRRVGAVDMYTAGLYLEKRANATDAVLASEGTKRLRVVMLRDVNGREMGELLSRGLVGNATDDELAGLIGDIVGLGNLIAEQGKLRAGDSFQIDWHPKSGTTVSINEKGRAKPTVQVFDAPDLVKVMMRIWLGPNPADAGLKNALLGQNT
jgi:hypothetical protein